MICVQLYQYLGIILAIIAQVSLIYTIVNKLDDFVLLVELMFFLSSITHSIGNFISHIIYRQRIQYVTFEMIHFSESIQPHEDVIIQRYIDKCIMLYGGGLFALYMSSIVLLAVPFLLGKPFPMPVEYPFNVYDQPLRTIIYLHHSVVGIQVSGTISSNILMGLSLWVISARLEMLADELRKTTDIYHLAKCIKKHQYLLKCATEVTFAARPFAFTTICCSTICTIIILLLFLATDNLTIMYQNIPLIASSLSEVFMYAWPAENLIHRSQDVAQTAFDMPWYDQSIKIRKCLQIIIRRSQKPITVAIPCVMPALSLSYFTSYFSTIVSYFTTLRVFLSD